jgi:hypothetical protein
MDPPKAPVLGLFNVFMMEKPLEMLILTSNTNNSLYVLLLFLLWHRN